MAKYTKTLVADSTGTYICNIKKKRDMPRYEYTVMGYGTFGGGTLTWYVSPNGGTTLIPMLDFTDTALSMTSDKMIDGSMCASSHNTDVLGMYLKLSGSTSASITAAVYDNN